MTIDLIVLTQEAHLGKTASSSTALKIARARSAMNLLTAYYHDADANRRAEFRECLTRNAANPSITAIHLFLEECVAVEEIVDANAVAVREKVFLIPHGKRVTYRDLFRYANAQWERAQVVIANADIFFDETLALLDGYQLENKLLCLSRWDVRADGSPVFFEHSASQDAWIFQTPQREFVCDFRMGVLGCDNRLAYEAERAGLVLANPARSVRANHLHLSGVRRYSARERLRGPTQAVPATYLAPENFSGNSNGQARRQETVYALTSLSPNPQNAAVVRECIRSWRDAGLKVRAFNHPDEVSTLAALYDVEFVPVTQTSAHVFGKHYIPINAMLDWATRENAPVLLINADIQLRLSPFELKRIRWLCDGGLCYFVRHNHAGDTRRAQREPYGIDAFFFMDEMLQQCPKHS